MFSLEHAGHRAGAGPRQPRLRGRGDQVLRALPATSPARMNNIGGEGIALWDEEDEFFYDVLHLPDGGMRRLKVRSLVGLIPLLAVETIEPDAARRAARLQASGWTGSSTNRPDLAASSRAGTSRASGERRLLALVRGHRMKRLLARMLDPDEFLSPYGIRVPQQVPRRRTRSPVALGGAALHGRLRAGRVAHRPVRRQLQLARPDLVPDQLPADRVAAASSTTTTATTSWSSARPVPADC